MSLTSLLASKAYADASAIKPELSVAGKSDDTKTQGGSDFNHLVTDLLDNVVETGKTGETTAINSLQGNSDMIDVVTALSAAETTLQTVISVRDKVISAYESIIRMPI